MKSVEQWEDEGSTDVEDMLRRAREHRLGLCGITNSLDQTLAVSGDGVDEEWLRKTVQLDVAKADWALAGQAELLDDGEGTLDVQSEVGSGVESVESELRDSYAYPSIKLGQSAHRDPYGQHGLQPEQSVGGTQFARSIPRGHGVEKRPGPDRSRNKSRIDWRLVNGEKNAGTQFARSIPRGHGVVKRPGPDRSRNKSRIDWRLVNGEKNAGTQFARSIPRGHGVVKRPGPDRSRNKSRIDWRSVKGGTAIRQRRRKQQVDGSNVDPRRVKPFGRQYGNIETPVQYRSLESEEDESTCVDSETGSIRDICSSPQLSLPQKQIQPTVSLTSYARDKSDPSGSSDDDDETCTSLAETLDTSLAETLERNRKSPTKELDFNTAKSPVGAVGGGAAACIVDSMLEV